MCSSTMGEVLEDIYISVKSATLGIDPFYLHMKNTPLRVNTDFIVVYIFCDVQKSKFENNLKKKIYLVRV